MVEVGSTRSRLKVDKRRAQLLELGLEMFSERTYDDISIEEIAKAAGISKGLLYHYFPGKRAFYLAVLQEASRQLVDQVTVDEAPHMNDMDRMRAGLEAFLSFVERHSVPFAFLLRGGLGGDEEVLAIVEHTRSQFAERMLEGLAFPASERIAIAVRGLIGMVEAASLEWVARKHMPRGELVDMLVDMCVATIAISAGQKLNIPVPTDP